MAIKKAVTDRPIDSNRNCPVSTHRDAPQTFLNAISLVRENALMVVRLI